MCFVNVTRHRQAGFAAEVVEFLIYAVLALESVVLLCSPKYLPWRIQLVVAVCQCYVDLKVSAALFPRIRHPGVYTRWLSDRHPVRTNHLFEPQAVDVRHPTLTHTRARARFPT